MAVVGEHRVPPPLQNLHRRLLDKSISDDCPPADGRGADPFARRFGLGRHEPGQVLWFFGLENCQNFLFRDEKLSGPVSLQKLGVKLKI